MSEPGIRLKRIYDPPSPEDGARVLVERLWPRGVTREAAALTRWAKEVAPSDHLRQWFGHEPARWEQFRSRYAEELARVAPLLDELRGMAATGRLTLLYAARDQEHNSAQVLRDVLLSEPHIAQQPKQALHNQA
jgi:uncharacterized protein YeaO (DUF488 family)